MISAGGGGRKEVHLRSCFELFQHSVFSLSIADLQIRTIVLW